MVKAETEPALREFVVATWPDDARRPSHPIFRVETGDPTAVILKIAATEAIELIVMGTQGLGGVRKWLLGSTTERVLRRTPVPVLAVPPAGKEPRVSRILAATDFSEPSITAVKTAAALAQQFSATLSLAHIVEPMTVPPQWHSLVEESDETRVADAGARLKALAEQWCGSQGCETSVSAGRPADLIGSIAEDRGADLIVMGLTGDQGPLAPRPGSIAYRVLGSTTVPVLVVPPSRP
jgi:nucleotide-binding universal stress UspA family protein